MNKSIQYSPNYQTLSGYTYPNSTVYVLLPDGTKLSAETGDNNYYTINIPEEHYFYKGEGKAEVWVSKNNKFESNKVEVEGFSDDKSSLYNYGTSANNNDFHIKRDGSQSYVGYISGFYSGIQAKLVLPDGFVIETRTEDGGRATFNIPAKHALKNGEKGLVTLKSPGGIINGEFTAYIVSPELGEINSPIEGSNTIGGVVNQHIKEENSDEDKSKISLIHVTLPNGKERLVRPDSKGNWILSTPVLKKGDVLKVSTEDIVGNISEPYIIKVGETPSVVKPENNKEEQKVNNEQGTNNETEKKSESKEKGKTEVKPTEEKVTSSSQTSQIGTSKETDLNKTSGDKILNSNSNVSKDKQITSNSDRKENNGTVVGEKSKTGYSNNTKSGLTSSVQKVQGKQNKSLPNTGTVNHLFAMISGLVSFIVGSVIFRLKRSN